MSYVDLTDIIRDQTNPSDRHSGYVVDLHPDNAQGIEFQEIVNDDGETVEGSWVHALSVGTYKHPLWGEIPLTEKRIRRFASNVNSGVRGIEPAIDYGHFSSGEAAGWVKKAEARFSDAAKQGLWIFVEWTKSAAEKIRNKEFRYFSSDFADEWEDPETGKTYEDVLFGGALTNRPFLKNLVPVNLSELFGEGQHKGKEKEEDEPMELTEQLREALGLSEDATEEDALEAIKQLSTEPAPPKEEEPPGAPSLPKELEEHPAIKGMLDSHKELQDEVMELRTERQLSEAKRLTEEWSTHSTKKFALPPAATEKLEELLVGSSKKFQDQMSEVMDTILESGLVKLGESGGRKPKTDGGEGEESAAAEVNKRVKKLQEENEGMSFADAYAEVSRDEELFERYRRESLAGAVSEINQGGDE